MWFLTLLLYVGFTIISELLRPKAKFGAPQPSGLGDIQVPTAQEGRSIPVIFGTCHLKGPNVVWYGNLVAAPITKKVRTGLFSNDKITTGYRYYLAQQLALCMGEVDDLLEVRFDDRPIPAGYVTIDSTNDGIVFGDISPATWFTAHVAHGNYSNLPSLAAAGQAAMRSAYGGGDWRVVYGYEVLSNSSDRLVYAIRNGGSFEPDETIDLSPGDYANGLQFVSVIVAEMNAREATVSGGARVRFSGTYANGRFSITATALRAGMDGWVMRGLSIDYDRSVLPMIGGTLAADQVYTSLPATWTSTYETGAKRFSFAYAGTDKRLGVADPAFTALGVYGLDSAPGEQPGGLPVSSTGSWGVVGAPTAWEALADNNDGSFAIYGSDGFISSGDLCLAATLTVVLGTLADPGNSTWTVRVRARREGNPGDGQVGLQTILKAGSVTIASRSDSLNLDEAYHDYEITLSGSEMNAFRSNGGFGAGGASIVMIANYSGLPPAGCLFNSCRIARAEFDIPGPDYAILKHRAGVFDREITGISITDLGDYWKVSINQPTMFGGEEREGGVQGRIDFYKGTTTQEPNDYLEAVIGKNLPGYRSLCYAVLRPEGFNIAISGWGNVQVIGNPAFYVGTSPYLKNISFVVRRCPNSLALPSGQENIAGDANPAAILYDILTNDRWGLAIPAGSIDAAAFRAAGAVLYAEGFGLSMNFDSSASARDLMTEVARHVDAVLYVDPQTALVTITLIRAGSAAVVLNRDNVRSVKMSRPAWDDTRNTVKVSYVDRDGNFMDRIAQAQDLANVQIRGGDISEDVYDFRGCSNATMGQALAARVLKTVSYPLAVFDIEVNRQAWPLRPGSVALLTWAELGIVEMAVRVTRIRTGDLNGPIHLDAVEDVFGIEATGYTLTPSTWEDPIAIPDDLEAAALVEAPYALVVGPDRLVMTLGGFGLQALAGYQVWASDDGSAEFALSSEVRELTPTGLLASQLDLTGTTMVVGNGAGVGLLGIATDAEFAAGKNVALIDSEFVAWQFITDNGDGTHTLSGVVRGVADTTPALHPAGARVWFVSEGAGFTSATGYDSDVTVRAKLLAFTALGVQTLGDVDELSIDTDSRALRPYVPARVLIGGILYPVIVGTGDIAVAWSHRNRLASWSWAEAGVTATPETGTTYTIRFYDEADTLKRTYTGLTGTSKTWTDEVSDCGHRCERVRIELEAVVAGLVSFQVFNWTVWRNMAQQDILPALQSRRVRRPRKVRVIESGEDA